MKKTTIELYVGLFVIIGLLCSAYLVVQLGGLKLTNKDRYTVLAYFSSVSGLKPGASVEMAGVAVGEVARISLDKERQLAKLELSIDNDYIFSEDVIASVKTSGIIGDKYINLSPGGAEFDLEPGATIFNTESSLDIESLVSKYIFSDKE
ncbi:MAG: outer membrane lipid asymmetry maintenance protein MlaD [Desulfobacterium sp.]|nr:outer membrane lipid asymmetry maintenance protein MlaD [Desulfobacterium sp.]